MTKLEELREQKKEIERQIRELKRAESVSGNVKYNHMEGLTHNISVLTRMNYRGKSEYRYHMVVREKTLPETIERLGIVIDDLQKMRKVLEDKANE